MLNLNLSDGFERFFAPRGINHEYESFKNKEKSIIVNSFESCATMIRCVEENRDSKTWHDSTGYLYPKMNGAWEWGFGDAKTLVETNRRLKNGICTDAQLKTFEDHKRILYEKYPELNELESLATQRKKRKSFHEDGDELDIDRYMDGAPEMWQRKTYQAGAKRTARLVYFMPTSYNSDTNKFIDNMCFVAAVSDIVERAGIGLEIFIGKSVTESAVNARAHGERLMITMIGFKSPEDQLDVERLISSGNVGMYRYYIFATQDNITSSRGQSCLGTPMSIADTREEAAPIVSAEITIIAGSKSLIEDKDEIGLCIKQIKQMFKQNVHA